MTLTHGELFAGISGFGVGFARSDIETVWHVEIDKHCRTVLGHHYPDSLILGDIRDVGKHSLPPVDIITFGSPCQDLSVAGKRTGLKGERSGLFYEAIRVVSELKPTFAVWENVPGAYTSNNGRDFAAVLSAFQECGARDIAWRSFDARYFALAQRRIRVFVVADFRGERAGEILFEPDRSAFTSPPRHGEGKGIAGTITEGSREHNPVVIKGAAIGRKPSAGPQRGEILDDGTVYTLNTTETHAVCLTPWDTQLSRIHHTNGVAPTLSGNDTGGQRTPVVFHENISGNVAPADYARALRSNASHNYQFALTGSGIVRRLTPMENERLQGFPDRFTAIGMSDSARYSMLGNAVAVPVTAWIGSRIINSF